LSSSYFTTESYPSSQRIHAWRRTLAEFSLCLNDTCDDDLYGAITSIVSPRGVLFGRITSGPQKLRYWDGKPNGDICLALHLEGDAVLVDEGIETDIKPRSILYGPVGAATCVTLRSEFRQVLVKIPGQAYRSRFTAPLPVKVGLLSGQASIGLVFAQLLGSIGDAIQDLTIEQIAPIDIALAEFLVTSLAAEDSNRRLQGATSTQTTLLHRILQRVESRLGDTELNVVRIAKDVGISVRYVHKLFESVGENFGHFVRTRRLERCRADLINPLYANLSITDICFRWLFNDAAHFSRSFREQFGMSPRSYRHQFGSPIARSSLLHRSRGWPDISYDTYRKLARNEVAHAKLSPGFAVKYDTRDPEPGNPTAAATASDRTRQHYVAVMEKNVHWGFLSRNLDPVLEVKSGDRLTIETLSHHAMDDYARMVKGDSGAESVFRWSASQKGVDRRGAGPMAANVYGRGPGEGIGVHICTGPIAVRGAEPGDVIEVRILDIRLRPSANPQFSGNAFGSNAATWWGFHYNELLTEPKPREVITIYEVSAHNPRGEYARPLYNFRWMPQTDPDGIIHPTIDYPGIPVDHTRIQENHGILKGVRVPVRPHFGVLALAPKESGLIDSIPPSYFGGNIDNKRATRGSTVYLPVSVPGGLFSVGDPHASQGDGEICGTAIECSLTGDFQLVLHKKHDLAGKPFHDLSYPLLETPDEWVVHGFTSSNYLAELGDTAQSEIYKKSSLDPALRDAFRKMRRFLMTTHGLSEDEAISLMSVAVDFGITQVSNGNWCVHGILRKDLFTGAD
jgi:acetamidase/formamidase/AraC-like DNA-binding protein